jgi:hypothetical protein
MATDRRILNLPLILSGNVTSSVVIPLDDPSDNLTKKINLDQIKDFILSGASLSGNYLSLSGGTVTGSTNFTGGLTANTLTVNGFNISGDTFVSGGTYNTGGTITLSYNIGGGFQITGLTEDLNNEISTLAEADEQTITLNLITNKIELKESILSPSGGTRTFQGNIIVNSGLTANSFIINNGYTPTSSGDTFGSIGQLTWDDDYLYVKTNNGWGRTILDYIF